MKTIFHRSIYSTLTFCLIDAVLNHIHSVQCIIVLIFSFSFRSRGKVICFNLHGCICYICCRHSHLDLGFNYRFWSWSCYNNIQIKPNLLFFNCNPERPLVSINVQTDTLIICFHPSFVPALIRTTHKLLYIIFGQYLLSLILRWHLLT
jgi:hypothetical protein